MTRKKNLFPTLGLLLLAGGGAYFTNKNRAAKDSTVLATARVERGSVRRVLEATGIIKAQVVAKIDAREMLAQCAEAVAAKAKRIIHIADGRLRSDTAAVPNPA